MVVERRDGVILNGQHGIRVEWIRQKVCMMTELDKRDVRNVCCVFIWYQKNVFGIRRLKCLRWPDFISLENE